jgi:hypothetical protein
MINTKNIIKINRSSQAHIRDFFTINLKVINNKIYFTIVDNDILFENLGQEDSIKKIRGNAIRLLTQSLKNDLLTNCAILKSLLPIHFVYQNNLIDFINNRNYYISILLFNLDSNKNMITNNIRNFYVYIGNNSNPNATIYRLNDFLNNINGLTPTLDLNFFPHIKTITCRNPINTNSNHSGKLKEIIHYYLTKDRCGFAKIIRQVHYNDQIIIFEKDDSIRSKQINRILFNIDLIDYLANIEEYTYLFSYNKLLFLYKILQIENIYNIDGSINEDLLLNICDNILSPNLNGGSKKLKDCTVLQLRKLMKKNNKSYYKDGKALKKSSMIKILQKK